MPFDEIAPGMILVERFGSEAWDGKCGIWLLHSGSECIITEMPRYLSSDPFEPVKAISKFLEEKKLTLKFITTSHHHWDHFYYQTYSRFYEKFKIPILVHSSFFPEIEGKNFITSQNVDNFKNLPPSIKEKGVPLHFFKDKELEVQLGQEPLYLIHSPKHCHSDTMIIFRGTMITSDWHIGPGDPNRFSTPIDICNESIEYLINFSNINNYRIKRLFAAHGNHLHWDVDFYNVMMSSKMIEKEN